MYNVAITVTFSAAHYHRGAGRECEQIHGHNYRVEVEVESGELRNDMVIDFRELRRQAREAVEPWDHRLLNEVTDFQRLTPTAENIARRVFEKLAEKFAGSPVALREVRVWEKEGSRAGYRE